MISGLEEALSTDGLFWIVTAIMLGGLVRGFAGFGAGMIIIPAMNVFADPVTVLVVLQVADGIGSLPLIPRGYRDGEPRQVALLVLSATLTLPIGLWFLTSTDSVVFRWIISALILALLLLMLSGWRYRHRLARSGTLGVGAVSGFMSGFSGLGGPPIILMYMSGPYKTSVIRGNIILFFAVVTVIGVGFLIWRDLFTAERFWLGLLLTPPYLLGIMLGARIFDPDREKLFRTVAYVVILASVLMSLPLWS